MNQKEQVQQSWPSINHQNKRQEIWTSVCANVSGAFNCESVNTSISWADKALKAFDERFPAPVIIHSTTYVEVKHTKDEHKD